MLSIRSLSKAYKVNGRSKKAVQSFSLDVAPGKVYCFLGPNGAGKTTAIKMLCGLVSPTTGTIAYNGRDSVENGWFLRQKTGAVLEGARNIHWRLTVRENIDYFCRLHGLAGYSDRAEKYMRMLLLEQHKNSECRYLSRENQQKTALACVLSLDAEILLLDEPTLGLDLDIGRTIMEVIDREKNAQRIIIVSTHDAEFIECAVDEVILFRDGVVTPLSSPGDIVSKYGNGDNRFSTAYLRLIRN
jgi:ABC-2 type transport system ATP-binding protein